MSSSRVASSSDSASGKSGGSAGNQPPVTQNKTTGDATLDDLIIQRNEAKAAMNLHMQDKEDKDILREQYKAARERNDGFARAVAERQKMRDRQQLALFPFPPTHTAIQLWRVKAIIRSTRRSLYVRANVYILAEVNQAYHDIDSNRESICYNGNDLDISVVFESMHYANSFQTALNFLPRNIPMIREVGDGVDSKQPVAVECDRNITLKRVFASEYRPGDNKQSPPWTVNLSQLEEAVPLQSVTMDESRQPQTLERSDWFASGLKACELHLKNQALFKNLANEPNNILYGSWFFHQYLDGLNTSDGLPRLAIRSNGLGELTSQHRRRVFVIIQFRDEDAASDCAFMLKAGSSVDSKNLLLYHSSVEVTNPNIFIECLQWKYDDTIAKWKHRDDALKVADDAGGSAATSKKVATNEAPSSSAEKKQQRPQARSRTRTSPATKSRGRYSRRRQER